MGALGRVRRVLKQSDVVLEVVDARFPDRSQRLKRMSRGKKFMLVLNKADLLPAGAAGRLARELGGIPFSARTRRGKRRLLGELESLARGRDLHVGVVGRPNVGKSSLINVLKGKKSASTSAQAGHTRAEQWIRVTPHVLLIDSPGIITWDEDEDELVLKDALDVDKAEDTVGIALKLFRRHPEVLEHLGLESAGAAALEEFARRTGKLKKGGAPNVKEAARMVVRKWQRGELNKKGK